MKLLKLTFLTLFLFVFTGTFAQNSPFRVGLNAGTNLSNARIGTADTKGTSFRTGFQVGVTVDYAMTANFNILSGISFIMKGSQIKNLDYTSYVGGIPSFRHEFEQQYIQLPLYGAYKIYLSNDLSFMFGVGPYFAYGVGGKTKEILHNSVWGDGTRERTYKTFKEHEEYGYYNELSRFDFGLGGLVNLEYKNINLNIGYDHGITDISKDNSFGYRNYSLLFSIGYKY